MQHNMRLLPRPFNMIKNGEKDIELRLYDEKRKLINVGDLIAFENTESGETIKTEVVDLHIREGFDEIYSAFDKRRLGYAEDESADYHDMEEYYSRDDILKYGAVGIEVSLL